MIRKVVNLVRCINRTESMWAIVEAASVESISSVEGARLWAMLTTHGIVPECDEESDQGIKVCSGNYDPIKHADLPLVLVSAMCESAVSGIPEPISTRTSRKRTPRKRRNTIRRAVTITRSIEQHQVKQMIVEASTREVIDAAEGQDLWWCCPHVPIQVDELVSEEFAIEAFVYSARQHSRMPEISLTESNRLAQLPASTAAANPILMDWSPSTSAHQLDKIESDRVSRIIVPAPNECYFNARQVLRSLPDYSDASYVEGFIVTHQGALFEHGWLIKNGKIVDPTIIEEGTVYFPGLEIAGRTQVQTFLDTELGRKCHSRPFHLAFYGESGIESPSFRRAGRKALKFLAATFGSFAVDVAAKVRAKEGLPRLDNLPGIAKNKVLARQAKKK